jgi:hypothetical protein
MKLQFFSLLLVLVVFGCEKAADTSSFKTGPSGQGGSLARFTVVNDYLYTVDKQNLKVFDISNPSQLVYKRTIPVGFEIETIFPFKDKLFVGSTSMVHIFSITDPANPEKLSEAISPTVMRRCDPVVAKDTAAYATLRTNGECGGVQSVLAVYDIRDVLHPVQKITIPVSEPYGLGYSGNTLYVCDRFQGIVIYDISKAYNPVFIKNISNLSQTNFIDVIPYNNILICWASNGMVLYDISNPQNPQLIQQIK